MSEAATSQFFERMKTDKALLNEYNSAVTNAMRSVVWPAMVDVAARHGFEITKEELGKYLESQAGELSEHELETVSGGGPLTFLATSPLVAGQIVATAIAVPVAIHGSDDDDVERP